MALKALGKKELKDLGCNFVVANVPVFAAISDPSKTNKMKIFKFKALHEVVDFMKTKPTVVFDLTGIYKEKADLQSTDEGYAVRCCPLEFAEFETLRVNLRETETLNFSYKFDFSCWHSGKI